MPVTVRLREGTTLGVTWAATRFPLDGALFPAPSGEQTLDLAGSFPMVIDFEAGPGYGGVGQPPGPQRPRRQHHGRGPARHGRAGRLRRRAAGVRRGRDHDDGRRTDRRERRDARPGSTSTRSPARPTDISTSR